MKGYGRLAVAGGVAANSRIRADLQAACAKSGDKLYLPELKYCGDNAAMIGCQGFYEYQAGHVARPGTGRRFAARMLRATSQTAIRGGIFTRLWNASPKGWRPLSPKLPNWERKST